MNMQSSSGKGEQRMNLLFGLAVAGGGEERNDGRLCRVHRVHAGVDESKVAEAAAPVWTPCTEHARFLGPCAALTASARLSSHDPPCQSRTKILDARS